MVETMELNKTLVIVALFSIVFGTFIGVFTSSLMNSSGATGYRAYPSTMQYEGSTSVVGKAESTVDSSGNINIPNTQDYMIIKRFKLGIQNDNVNKVVNDIIAQAELMGGRIQSANFNQYKYYDEGEVVVKIPRENEEKFLNYLKQYKITSITIYAYDVSNQYNSLEAQIELLQTKIKFYEEFISNNSRSLTPEQIERYYDKIFSLKSQLYYLQKQKSNLANQTLYSTFTIRIYNDKTYKVAGVNINFDKIWYNIKLSWAYIFVLTIYFVTIIVPLIIIVYAIYYAIKRIRH